MFKVKLARLNVVLLVVIVEPLFVQLLPLFTEYQSSQLPAASDPKIA
jgi:hypothetical protein